MRENQKQTILYGFRVTPEEAAIIEQKMAAAGIRNRSAFFRAMVLKGYLLKLDLPELREATRLMGHLSGNVNQIARRMNEKGNIYDTEIDDIVQGEKEIVETMGQILSRLNHIIEEF